MGDLANLFAFNFGIIVISRTNTPPNVQDVLGLDAKHVLQVVVTLFLLHVLRPRNASCSDEACCVEEPMSVETPTPFELVGGKKQVFMGLGGDETASSRVDVRPNSRIESACATPWPRQHGGRI